MCEKSLAQNENCMQIDSNGVVDALAKQGVRRDMELMAWM